MQSGMLPADLLDGTPAAPSVDAEAPTDARPPHAHREAYHRYVARLAAWPDAAAALRRLIPYLDADLDGAERLALWQALWQLRRRCARTQGNERRQAIEACLDGRHRDALAALDAAWNDPALVEHLARATPPGDDRTRFVPALLAHHDLQPLAQPGTHRPALVLLAAQARVHREPARLPAAAVVELQAAALNAAERDASLLPDALSLLFELALHARDVDTATAVLAELLRHRQAQALRRDRVRAWLDGTAFSDDEDSALPLLLAAPWQAQWLQPAAWAHPATLVALHDNLQRSALQQRLQTLATQLLASDGHAPTAAASTPRIKPEALRALRALDVAYDLVERGGDPVPALRPLLQPDTLTGKAIAALHRASARWHAARGDAEGQAVALLLARQHQSSPALRATLATLLPVDAPTLSADWRDEAPGWQRLLKHRQPRWRRLAAFQLAQLWTDGQLEPRPPRRCQDLTAARAQWQALATHARYAPWAQAALQHPLQTVLQPALQRHGQTEYLWFDTPGAHAVTIVFSCIASHHSFPEVAALRGRLPGQHLMFVRCPEKNWYCDETYDAVHALLQQRVQPHFTTGDVTCWYGSMGGHGALKFALAFGWRAIVFNPQTDLDLWAAFRPTERALLWGAERHARLQALPLSAWARTPQYIACGAATADREALSLVIDQLRRCHHATAIIEKFDDPHHAGLMNRIAGGPVAPVLGRITERLKQLSASTPAEGTQALDGPAAAGFWQRLDDARALKVELQVRDGRLWWQPSRACSTRP